MHSLVEDVRYAVRGLRQSPWIAAAVVASLALAIGADTAVFTFVGALLTPPLPVSQPERLAAVYTREGKHDGYYPVSFLNFRDLRSQNKVFSDLVAHLPVPMNLGRGDQAERILGEIVSGNYFPLLGVVPALGRAFLPEEDQTPEAHPVAVLGYGLWQRRFGAAPDIVGRTVTLNGRDFVVVGVAPRGFAGTSAGVAPDVWVPLMMHESILATLSERVYERRALVFQVFGRLEPGVSLQQAQASMRTVARQLEEEYPEPNKDRSVTLVPLLQARLDPNLRGPIVAASALLAAVVGCVLLIACANVTNLLLARAAARRREMVIRLALGASRGRLVRQLLAESLLLAGVGSLLGLALAAWATRALWALRPPSNVPIALRLEADTGVLLFTLGVALVAGLASGLTPALQSARSDLVGVLKEQATAVSHTRALGLRNVLVAVQVALSVFLVIAATLFVRSLGRAQSIDPGFRVDHMLLVPLEVGLQGYSEQRGRAFYKQVVSDAEALPGVISASTSQSAPLDGGQPRRLLIEGRDAPDADGLPVLTNIVGPGYFETLGIPLLQGRDFSPGDTAGAPPMVIVNDTLARRLWPDESALGRRVRFANEDTPREIVGVTRTCKHSSLGEPPRPFLYLPLSQNYAPWGVLYVHTRGEPAGMLPALRDVVRRVDPDLPVFGATTFSEGLKRYLWPARMGAAILGFFGLLGGVLAVVGVYGVVAKAAAQRTREIGIRLALGGQRGDVLRLVLRRGVGVVASGLLLGLLAALASTRALSGLLFGVAPTDAPSFVGALAALSLVALAAIYLPARRASRADPVASLRCE